MSRTTLWLVPTLIASACWQVPPAVAQTPLPSVSESGLRDWIATGAERAALHDSFLETDGPSFTRSSKTIRQGMFQLETRYLHLSRPSVDIFPRLIGRFGLTSRVECRAEWSGVDSGAGFRSSEDLEVGFKFAATTGEEWIPESALLVELFTPTGYGQNAIGRVSPEVDYIYSWRLADSLSLSGSTGAIFGQPNAPSVTLFYQSLSLSYTFWDEHLVAFGEAFSLFGSGTNQGAVLPSLDAGLLLRPTHSLQLDWRVGMGLNEQAPAFFTGAGISVRY